MIKSWHLISCVPWLLVFRLIKISRLAGSQELGYPVDFTDTHAHKHPRDHSEHGGSAQGAAHLHIRGGQEGDPDTAPPSPHQSDLH